MLVSYTLYLTDTKGFLLSSIFALLGGECSDMCIDPAVTRKPGQWVTGEQTEANGRPGRHR
jgi:hypothetical protein